MPHAREQLVLHRELNYRSVDHHRSVALLAAPYLVEPHLVEPHRLNCSVDLYPLNCTYPPHEIQTLDLDLISPRATLVLDSGILCIEVRPQPDVVEATISGPGMKSI